MMAPRRETPDILGAVLGPVEDSALIRDQLRYDYSLIPAERRTAVQAAAVEIVRAGRQAQENLLSVGQRLIEVKDMLDHGQFSDWCATEFDMSQRTAQRMMQVAEVFAGKNDKLSFLSDSAMYLLAAPSTPEAARVQVIEEAESTGQKPTVARVQEVISQHKPTSVKVTRMDDAAEDAWRPPGIGARPMQQETPAVQPPNEDMLYALRRFWGNNYDELKRIRNVATPVSYIRSWLREREPDMWFDDIRCKALEGRVAVWLAKNGPMTGRPSDLSCTFEEWALATEAMKYELLATGGTIGACCKLVEQSGAKVVACAFVIELAALKGAERIGPYETYSVIKYE
jgi:hypothetical protein